MQDQRGDLAGGGAFERNLGLHARHLETIHRDRLQEKLRLARRLHEQMPVVRRDRHHEGRRQGISPHVIL